MPTPKHGLGRGLDALITKQVRPAPIDAGGVQQVELTQIEPYPHQPRHMMQPDELNELAASIREHGVLQPLLLTTAPANGNGVRYHLIAGERRWRAAKLAGLHQVPASVRGSTPQEMLELALVENIQRAALNPLEEAEAYHQLIDGFGLTQEQVAHKVGKDRTTVSNVLRLLRLPAPLKEALAGAQISEGHARALLQLNDEARMQAMCKLVIARHLSVRQTEELVRRTLEATQPRASHKHNGNGNSLPPDLNQVQDDLRRALGTKVDLVHSAKGSRIIIEFYSDEELDAIYRRICK